MTLSTSAVALDNLRALPDRQSLLLALKDLKNSVIGNTLKKVEAAGEDGLKEFLLSQLVHPRLDNAVDIDILNETSVIIGAIANEGRITLRPLILARAPASLLELVRATSTSGLTGLQQAKLLPSVLRALRNVLTSAADAVWGHVWGVAAELKVVGTGLVGPSDDEDVLVGKGKGVSGRNGAWRHEAFAALKSVCEPDHLDTLLSVLQKQTNPQILLPIYQLLARLVVLPSNRDALLRWTPQAGRMDEDRAGPSSPRQAGVSASMLFQSGLTVPVELPFILQHLLAMITDASSPIRRAAPRPLEAALDLLAALVHGQPDMVAVLRGWTSNRKAADQAMLEPLRSPSSPLPSTPGGYLSRSYKPQEPELWTLLLEFVKTASTPVRISAASCLANIAKAEPSPASSVRSSAHVQVDLIQAVVGLFQTVSLEDKVKLCFVVGTMTSDDPAVGMASFGIKSHQYMIEVLDTIEHEDEKGNLSRDLACRGREAALLGLSSLAFTSENARVAITESELPCMQYLLSALSHPSYGVRAAACQLARALSRTVSLVRTSLTDSGISTAVIECLQREVARRRSRANVDDFETDEEEGDWQDDSQPWIDQTRTVEVCALMTLCNLIASFSPLKDTLLAGSGLETICDLTHSSHEPTAMNALWALKNAMFKSTDAIKARILNVLGIEQLRTLISPSTPAKLRIQALNIVQNYLADGNLSDLSKGVDLVGEEHLLDTVIATTKEGPEPELYTAAMGILVNLSWGNEKMRSTLSSRPEIVDALARALGSKQNGVKYAALKALRNLITSTTRSSRPRQAMLDVFQPYQLKTRVKEIVDTSRDLDVMAAANGLYEVLDKAKGGGTEVLKEDFLDR